MNLEELIKQTIREAVAEALNALVAPAPGTTTPATGGAAGPAPAPAEAPAKPKRGRPAKTEAATPAVPEPSPESVAAPAPALPVENPPATQDDVRKALTDLKTRTNQETALAVLHGFAANLSALVPSQYAEVVKVANATTQVFTPVTKLVDDPFEATTPAPAPEIIPTAEEVKAACIDAQKRSGTEAAQKTVMAFGGVAVAAGEPPRPSVKNVPESKRLGLIAALKALPTTK